jgi:excisionase family DNA binding protein
MSTTLLTTAEVADRLGLTVRAIQKMIEAGRLPAQKVGRDYLIAPDALKDIPKQAAGRPPKQKAEDVKPARKRKVA